MNRIGSRFCLDTLAVLTIGASCALASPAAPVITIDRTFDRVAGWSIGYSKSLDGCLAAAAYQDGTTIWLGFGGSTDRAFLAFTNERWRAIEVGQSYEIQIATRGEGKWHGTFAGFERNGIKGVFTSGLKDRFVSDLANAGALDVSLEGRPMASLSLVGSTDALGAVARCQKEAPTFQADGGSVPIQGSPNASSAQQSGTATIDAVKAAGEAAARLKSERLEQASQAANMAIAEASVFVKANADDAQVLDHIQHIADLKERVAEADPAQVEQGTAALIAGLNADPIYTAFSARQAVERKREDALYLADAIQTLKVQKTFLIRSLVQDPTSPQASDILILEKQAESVIANPDLDRAKTTMGLIDAAIDKSGLKASYALARSAVEGRGAPADALGIQNSGAMSPGLGDKGKDNPHP